jgi:cyclin-dependent kinase 7
MWRKPLFVAERDKELSQLQVIFAVLGTPKQDEWPYMKYLQNYVSFEAQQGRTFHELFPAASDQTVDLISRLLTYNPAKRITAKHALQHPYFTSAPSMTPIHQLPKIIKGTANK